MMAISFNEIYVQLFLAMLFGMAIGVERFVAHKTAGMRTYSLVSMGAALFVIISKLIETQYGLNGYDFHIAAQIIAAAGFLGVGAIFHNQNQTVTGITTATGLWVAAGVGMACGFGLYSLAAMVTGLTLFVFIVLWFIEKQIRRLPIQKKEESDSL